MTEREPYKKQVGKVVSYFTSLMALFYLGAGAYLIFSETVHKMFSPNFCIILGLGLIFYGLFRLYRAFIFYTKGE